MMKPPQRVEAILTPLVANLTAARRPSAEEVAQVWRQLVGARAAQHSQPTGLRRGELLVAVDTSAWLWTLSLERPRLLAALRAAWGAEAIATIRLRITPSIIHR